MGYLQSSITGIDHVVVNKTEIQEYSASALDT